MQYVYIIKSITRPDKTYLGCTNNLRRRLRDHNSGQSTFTKSYRPWKLEMYLAFSCPSKAKSFERYLKGGGGWRFAERRLI